MRQFELFLYGVFGVTAFTIFFNGTHAISRDRSPTFFRVLGGVLGTIELVPGLLILLYPGDDKDAGAILTSFGGAAVLGALLSGGKKKDKTVLVSPTSEGGAVMSMAWSF